ncbi:MAG: PPC domain-containing protein [Planctomycetota bacterium]|jgi:hypothetical protein
MRTSACALLLATFLCAPAVLAQEKREPHIGYLYPAGGERGTVVQVFTGGQNLRGIKDVDVSGRGVKAKIVRHLGRWRNINGEERQEVMRLLREAHPDLLKDLPERRRGRRGKTKEGKEKKEIKLPNHPLIKAIPDLSPPEVEFFLREYIVRDRKKQPNSQIAETVLIEVTIDEDAPPGDRELRLTGNSGLTNPMCFQVGSLPEARETEPLLPRMPDTPPLDLPVTVNGQIRPGDTDLFRFTAEEGQRLVIQAQARHLIPFLADAVPGWFQATLTLFDEKGNEVAFVDDYQFHPDPVLFFEVPETGEYRLEVRDSIYRGREDFIYRISIGETPFIRSMFPLGGPAGSETTAVIQGWNLPARELSLDTTPDEAHIRSTSWSGEEGVSNRVAFAVDDLPECFEVEPNDTVKKAQKISKPQIVNGRIGAPGDVDVFRFRGKAGEEVVAEVFARRLYSPVDSLLRLTHASGNVLAWNDDLQHKEGHLHKEMGVLTHHADSYLRAELPKSGYYFVHVTDTVRNGGDACGYRLRISRPRPDFALRVTPSSINLIRAIAVPITVHVLRRDGFDGDVEVSLKDALPGFRLQGGVIPSGRDCIRMTLTSPLKPPGEPIALHMEGRAHVNGRTITRPVAPSENMMQAFLWRHLVPSRHLVVAVRGGGRRIPSARVEGDLPVAIPAGGTAEVRIRIPGRRKFENVVFKLSDPPKGVTLKSSDSSRDGMKLVLKVDEKEAEVGFADNLIVEIYQEVQPRGRDGKPRPKRQIYAGVLPAIPVVIMQGEY